jgi:hypothetical protein
MGKSEVPMSGDGYVKMDRDLSRDPSQASEKLFLAYKLLPTGMCTPSHPSLFLTSV